MSKTSRGFGIGFVAGGVLGFLVVTGVISNADSDVAMFAPFYGIIYSPVAAILGGAIGTIIGGVTDWREEHVSPNRCRRCSSRVRGNPKNCRVCGLEEPMRK